jgi:hypothetical protein
MRVVKGRLAILTLVLAAAPASVVLAQGGGEGLDAGADRAALDEFCSGVGPCMIVNGHADPTARDSTQLATPGDVLASGGNAPDACPNAAAAYAAAGVDVDAFVGPCPSATEAAAVAEHIDGDQVAAREVPQ